MDQSQGRGAAPEPSPFLPQLDAVPTEAARAPNPPREMVVVRVLEGGIELGRTWEVPVRCATSTLSAVRQEPVT